MTEEGKLKITIKADTAEDVWFKENEKARLKKLHEKANEAVDSPYREAHAYHCFRCGTPSLVEISHSDMKIDVCVNEGCGAVHLDPGELEAIEKSTDRGLLARVRNAVIDTLH